MSDTSKPDWTAEIEVDADRAAVWIAARWPELAGLPVRLAGEGWDNAVFRVGEDWVFRLPRRELGASLLAMELGVLPHLAAHLPLPIPEPVFRGESGADTPHGFAGYRWLDGTTADRAGLDDPARAALARPLGAFLRALHRCDPPAARGADPGDVIHRADRRRRLPSLLQHLESLEHPAVDKARVASALTRLSEGPDHAGPPVWVHGDLYPRHLVVRGGSLVGVIDWGDTHRGDPALDLSIALTFLPEGARPAFVEAYGTVDEAAWTRARFRALHYGIHLLRYGIAEDDQAMVDSGLRALEVA